MKLVIEHDEFADDPRESQTFLATFAFFGNRSHLSDKNHGIHPQDYGGWQEMEDELWKRKDILYVSPVYCYEHGGSTISLQPFSCPWDSAQIGVMFVTRQKAIETFGWRRFTAGRLLRVTDGAQADFQTLKYWWEGECYGWKIMDGENEVDSCWGFYGEQYAKESGQEELERLQAA